jgi:hypothetical protein
MRRAIISTVSVLVLGGAWSAAAAQSEVPEDPAGSGAQTQASEEAPATQTAPAAEPAGGGAVQLPPEEELVARVVELRRRRSELVAQYNATYTLTEKKRLEAELRRADELLDQALGEQALRAERDRARAAGQPVGADSGSPERGDEIAARLAELQRKRRELIDRYNTTYSLREKSGLQAEIERTEALIRSTEAELALSRQAAQSNPP